MLRIRPFIFSLLLLLLATSASANLYVPKAKLAGETVQVLLDATSAEVQAVFEFEDWMTLDDKIIYFPVFGYSESDPAKVLAEAKFELEVAEKKLNVALPCEPPERFKDLSKANHIYWFSVNLDHLFEDEVWPFGNSPTVKLRYIQPLIDNKFCYLPVIIGKVGNTDTARAWQYQMHVVLYLLQYLWIGDVSHAEKLMSLIVFID